MDLVSFAYIIGMWVGRDCAVKFVYPDTKKTKTERNFRQEPLTNWGSTSCTVSRIIHVFLFAVIRYYEHCYLSHIMRKPVYSICEQQRRRSA